MLEVGSFLDLIFKTSETFNVVSWMLDVESFLIHQFTQYMSKLAAILSVSFCLMTVGNSRAGFEPLADISGRAQWQAGPGTPEAVYENLKFPCQFKPPATRLYWDSPVSLDLGKTATIELELFCPDHEAVQSVGLYLQSGNGWYLWIQPLVKSGRQKFFFQARNAATEGKPAGWDKIRTVRVALQNNAAASASVILLGLRAGASGIILVKGTSSAPDNGEKKVAGKAAARLSSWLEAAGVCPDPLRRGHHPSLQSPPRRKRNQAARKTFGLRDQAGCLLRHRPAPGGSARC